jgi:hypothetical protein
MFGATTLSGSVVYGSQRSECSFIIWFGNFAVQDSMYDPRGRIAVARRAKSVGPARLAFGPPQGFPDLR